MKNKYSPFFAAYNASVKAGNPNSKEEVIEAFTNGRTRSLKDLDVRELQELVRRLQMLVPAPSPSERAGGEVADKMRKAIIAIFRSMNKTVDEAIAWAEKQGVKGIKKQFNSYTTGELYVLIAIAEKIKAGWQKDIRKQITEKMNHEQD
ncbi:MAG: hypothetical protein JST21_13065 [Bacteroidetes bacterium]|nr:hypothetical protein [Bacteroidota bacterium]